MIQTLIELIWSRKYTFFGTFFLVFLGSYLILIALDFVPEPKSEPEIQDVAVEDATDSIVTESPDAKFNLAIGDVSRPIMPTSIYIKKLDRTIPVLNPITSSIAELDEALLSGVVRHPDSANLAQAGNVFILGHSSYLPSVANKNFQAFNGIQDLEWGDIIEVTSDSYVHIYEVEKVFRASAQDAEVPLTGTGPRLTLATCNSFGSKDDRFIVEAKRIEVRSL